MNENEVVEYQVEVKGLQHKAGTREVMQIDVGNFETKVTSMIISQQLGRLWKYVILG